MPAQEPVLLIEYRVTCCRSLHVLDFGRMLSRLRVVHISDSKFLHFAFTRLLALTSSRFVTVNLRPAIHSYLRRFLNISSSPSLLLPFSLVVAIRLVNFLLRKRHLLFDYADLYTIEHAFEPVVQRIGDSNSSKCCSIQWCLAEPACRRL